MKFIKKDKYTKKSAGIYKIVNIKNGKFYIGSTMSFKNRFNAHKKDLEKGCHANDHLSRDYVKCGSESFIFEVLKECSVNNKKDRDCLFDIEQKYLDKHFDNGKTCYNLSKDARVPVEYIVKYPICQLDKNGKSIKTWTSAAEASKALNINEGSIRNAAKGHNITYKGYRWIFMEKEKAIKYKPREKLKNDPRLKKSVLVNPITFDAIGYFKSQKALADYIGVKAPMVQKIILNKSFEYVAGKYLAFTKENYENNKASLKKEYKSICTHKCLACGLLYKTPKALSTHIQKTHNINAVDYTIKYFYGGRRPLCFDCEAETRYERNAFKKYCKKHAKNAMKEGGRKGGRPSKQEKEVKLLKLNEYNNLALSDFTNKPTQYGSTDVLFWKGIELIKNNVKNMSPEEKNLLSQDLFDYFRKGGFPYPAYTKEVLLADWEYLKEKDISLINKWSTGIVKLSNKTLSGRKLFNHFNGKQLFQVKSRNKKPPSMLDAFEDDKLLKEVINNRLGITYKEHFNISGAMLRTGFKSSRKCFPASVFNCLVAKYMYETYTSSGDIVFDYSMGFGQRMLGALSSKNNLFYIGCDPWEELVDNNEKMAAFVKKEKMIDLYKCGSEEFFAKNKYKNKVSFAFSSPPYFDKEIYNKKTQNCMKNYKYFMEIWWSKTVNNIKEILKPEGKLALNMIETYGTKPILNDMIEICCENGFVEIDRLYLDLTKGQYVKSIEKNKLEPIIIMKKK